MATSRRPQKFNVVYNSKKLDVFVNPGDGKEITVEDLAKTIANVSQIPIDKQKLICRGKTLFPGTPTATLQELGVSHKDKILLIGKRVDLEEMRIIKGIEKVDYDVEELWKKFQEKKVELDGIEQGFLDKTQGKESLQKLSKQILGLGEGLMKQLESLDAFTLQQNFTDAREKRKAVVVKIQTYLRDIDSEEERIKDLCSKL